MTHFYRLYGLSLAADEALPGLVPGAGVSGDADVSLELRGEPGWVHQARMLPSKQLHHLAAEPATQDPAFVITSYDENRFFGLSYSDGTQFFVDGEGARVWGTWAEPWTKEDLATYLLGPVMGSVLRRRGVTPLHASGVCLAGRAVLFCGDAQAGKSTTAAAMALRGEPVLCEDIAALRVVDGHNWVEPGYPRVCLWPDSVAKLMGRSDALPLLTPNWEKRYLPLDGAFGNFQEKACVLGAVYVLGPRTEEGIAHRIEPMTPRDALLELVQNSYMNWLLDREQRAEEFGALTHLVQQVPVRRIKASSDAKGIEALCRGILADAESLPAGEAPVIPPPNLR